jgi:hypothetical protein
MPTDLYGTPVEARTTTTATKVEAHPQQSEVTQTKLSEQLVQDHMKMNEQLVQGHMNLNERLVQGHTTATATTTEQNDQSLAAKAIDALSNAAGSVKGIFVANNEHKDHVEKVQEKEETIFEATRTHEKLKATEEEDRARADEAAREKQRLLEHAKLKEKEELALREKAEFDHGLREKQAERIVELQQKKQEEMIKCREQQMINNDLFPATGREVTVTRITEIH